MVNLTRCQYNICEGKPVCKLKPINTASSARVSMPMAKVQWTKERRSFKITKTARLRLKAAATNGRIVSRFISERLKGALRVASYGLRVASYGLRVTGCGLRVAGYGLRVMGYGLRGNGSLLVPLSFYKLNKLVNLAT